MKKEKLKLTDETGVELDAAELAQEAITEAEEDAMRPFPPKPEKEEEVPADDEEEDSEECPEGGDDPIYDVCNNPEREDSCDEACDSGSKECPHGNKLPERAYTKNFIQSLRLKDPATKKTCSACAVRMPLSVMDGGKADVCDPCKSE